MPIPVDAKYANVGWLFSGSEFEPTTFGFGSLAETSQGHKRPLTNVCFENVTLMLATDGVCRVGYPLEAGLSHS